MPIRVVINGFFRSGTTLLWDWLRGEFPDARCFYEPLHPELERLATKEQRDGKAHPDHRLLLWEEYNRLPATTRAGLLRVHPGRLGPDWSDEKPLFRYLDRFHELPGDVILQPCRTSFFLNALSARYGATIVHIVRHPLKVLDSMRRSASGSRFPFMRWLRRARWTTRVVRGFDLQETARWIRSRTGDFAGTSCNGFLELFLFVWIHSNHQATWGIEASDGTMIAYEELLADPGRVRARLERGLGGPLTSVPALRSERSSVDRESAVPRMLDAIKRLGLMEPFREVCVAVESATGQDYLDPESTSR